MGGGAGHRRSTGCAAPRPRRCRCSRSPRRWPRPRRGPRSGCAWRDGGDRPRRPRSPRRRLAGGAPARVPRPQPGATGPMLRVLTMNLYFGRADAEVVVARVRQVGADVLFLQELTADAVTRLKQAGLDDLMPHTQLELRGGSRGSGIYSRFPLSEGPSVAAGAHGPADRAARAARRGRGGAGLRAPRHPEPGARRLRVRGARSSGCCRRRASCRGCSRGTSTPPSTMPRSATCCASATPTPRGRRGTR